MTVDAGAIEDHVVFLDSLAPLVVAQQKTKRFGAAAGVAAMVLSKKIAPADVQHRRVFADGRRQRRRQRQRLQVDGEVIAAGEKGVGFRQRMLRRIGADARSAQRRRIHAERAEHADMAPAAEMFADSAALIDGEGEVQRGGVQGGFQADRPAADYGDPRRFHPRHIRSLR